MTDRKAFEAWWQSEPRPGPPRMKEVAWLIWFGSAKAERERCAKIADDHEGWQDNPANCIAAKIMEGRHESGQPQGLGSARVISLGES